MIVDRSVEREITITVPVPRLHVLHTASLTLHDPMAQNPVSQCNVPTIHYVGQSLSATLRMSHTQRWDSTASIRKAAELAHPSSKGRSSSPIEFSYEILANPEVWLVGGQRKRRFEAIEGEQIAFDLILVPLRQGRLMLPGLDVRWIPPEGLDGGAADDGRGVASETVYESAGETVLVVPNVGSSTVELRGFGTGGVAESVLLKSEPRAIVADVGNSRVESSA